MKKYFFMLFCLICCFSICAQEKPYTIDETPYNYRVALKEMYVWEFDMNDPINLQPTQQSIIKKVIRLDSQISKTWLLQIYVTVSHQDSTFCISIDSLPVSRYWGRGTQGSWDVMTFMDIENLKADKYLITLDGKCDTEHNRVSLVKMIIFAYPKY